AVGGVHRVEARSVDALVDGPAVGHPAGAVQSVVVADAAELGGVPVGGVGALEVVGNDRAAQSEVAGTAAVGERVVRGRLDLGRDGEHVLHPFVEGLAGVGLAGA